MVRQLPDGAKRTCQYVLARLDRCRTHRRRVEPDEKAATADLTGWRHFDVGTEFLQRLTTRRTWMARPHAELHRCQPQMLDELAWCDLPNYRQVGSEGPALAAYPNDSLLGRVHRECIRTERTFDRGGSEAHVTRVAVG